MKKDTIKEIEALAAKDGKKIDTIDNSDNLGRILEITNWFSKVKIKFAKSSLSDVDNHFYN